jgi:hypothetical protein
VMRSPALIFRPPISTGRVLMHQRGGEIGFRTNACLRSEKKRTAGEFELAFETQGPWLAAKGMRRCVGPPESRRGV